MTIARQGITIFPPRPIAFPLMLGSAPQFLLGWKYDPPAPPIHFLPPLYPPLLVSRCRYGRLSRRLLLERP